MSKLEDDCMLITSKNTPTHNYIMRHLFIYMILLSLAFKFGKPRALLKALLESHSPTGAVMLQPPLLSSRDLSTSNYRLPLPQAPYYMVSVTKQQTGFSRKPVSCWAQLCGNQSE